MKANKHDQAEKKFQAIEADMEQNSIGDPIKHPKPQLHMQNLNYH